MEFEETKFGTVIHGMKEALQKKLCEDMMDEDELRDKVLDLEAEIETLKANAIADKCLLEVKIAENTKLKAALQQIKDITKDREAFVMQGPRAFSRAWIIASDALAAAKEE